MSKETGEITGPCGCRGARLLECIDSDAEAEEIAAQLEAVADALVGNPEAQYLLASLRISKTQALEFVAETFTGRVSQLLEALLTLMAQNCRLNLLGGVARRFRQLLNEREGRLEAIATTAVPVSEQVKARISSRLAEILGRDAELHHIALIVTVGVRV